ncbi:hypothetical protein B2G71_05740 [Novosphingobium sp. PC22D]|nr:hypothetical protein B2G71_05740 [Novosphingobium sp. PC22D]
MVRALADHLPGLAPDMEFLLLRHPDRPARTRSAQNVREVVVPASPNGPATLWWLPRVVDLSGVDLFHATANILPAGLPMPTVTTVHDIMWLTAPRLCNPRLYGLIERAFYGHGMRRALRRSSAIVTVSEATRNAIAEFDPEAAHKVRVALSGVSETFRAVTVEPRQLVRLGLNPARRFVLVVGQSAPYKNHEGALRGFHAGLGGDEDVDLVFVQRRGPGAARLLALADELGLMGRVQVFGAVAPDELVMLYSAAAALLHPSLCEGFGNPLAEAMACGCPVVTSDRSAMPEVTGEAALHVDPNDPRAIGEALCKVLYDPTCAKRLRERGLIRGAELDWRRFALHNLVVYREVLGLG